MNTIKKQNSKAFNKEVVLIGEHKDGGLVWLEFPKWDCSWYWGFGYLEMYCMRNGNYQNNPIKAHDISSHTHFSGAVGQMEKYDNEKHCFVKGEYIHTLDKNPLFLALTLNERELWSLSELFRRFYLLQEMAAYYYQGGCHCTSLNKEFGNVANDVVKNIEAWKRINTIEIPPVIEAIIKLLHPNPDSVVIAIPEL